MYCKLSTLYYNSFTSSTGMHSRASRSAGRGQRPAPGAAHLKRWRPMSFSGGDIPRGGAGHGKWRPPSLRYGAARRRDRSKRWRPAGCRTSLHSIRGIRQPRTLFLLSHGDSRNREPAAARVVVLTPIIRDSPRIVSRGMPGAASLSVGIKARAARRSATASAINRCPTPPAWPEAA